MIALGIDSSAVSCSVAVSRDGVVLASRFIMNGLTHSTSLLPAIRDVLNQANVRPDVIGITCGPGSFTGLRIGLSTVKGLAVYEDLPCAALSTLEVIAMNGVALEGYTVVSLMDARRDEFYTASFFASGKEIERICEDSAKSAEVIAEEIAGIEKLLLVGDGAEKFCSLKPEFMPYLSDAEHRYQNGVHVALLSEIALMEKRTVTAEKLAPNYLRLPQAEREWREKNK